MPLYTYRCLDCEELTDFYLSISSFLDLKDSLKCLECNSKNVSRALSSINSAIEKNSFEAKEEMQRDINLISKKIKSGDQRTIESIYGKE